MNWRLHACFEGFVVQGEEYILNDMRDISFEQSVKSTRGTSFSRFHADNWINFYGRKWKKKWINRLLNWAVISNCTNKKFKSYLAVLDMGANLNHPNKWKLNFWTSLLLMSIAKKQIKPFCHRRSERTAFLALQNSAYLGRTDDLATKTASHSRL